MLALSNTLLEILFENADLCNAKSAYPTNLHSTETKYFHIPGTQYLG